MFFAMVIMLLLILAPLLAGVRVLPSAAAQESYADLTGRVFDHGEDTDGDGFFDFLVVNVEVEVNVAGSYEVSLDALRDENYSFLYLSGKNETYLDVGMHNVSLLLSGIAIHGSKLDFSHASWISLSYTVGYSKYSTQRYDIPLSMTYSYTLFDNGATLTGNIHTEGNDTDSDGLFNYLELTAEINVTDEAEYELSVSGLHNVSDYSKEYILVWNSTKAYLYSGIRNLTVSLLGASMYASHAINISEVANITLGLCIDNQRYSLDSASLIPLTRAYSYQEFERIVYFTGTLFDVGVDSDGDSKYDYLELRVEINVTEPGDYTVLLQSLLDNFSKSISLYDSRSAYFEAGVHLVNFTVYGPRIYGAHFDPAYVETMEIYDANSRVSVVDRLSKVPLTTIYKWTDFESHASFTGNHTDIGVDTDGDGLFDYLAVGIEVNVTEAGTYGVYADYIMGTSYYNLYNHIVTQEYFTRGVHWLYLNYSGPMLAQAHFSPMAISYVGLFEKDPSYFELDRMSSVVLSRSYDHTLFDASLRDTQVSLVVYPSGTVSLGGKFNYTHMYPSGIFPTANTTIDFSTSGNTTICTANGTIVFPPSLAPLNSTTGHLSTRYADGLLNATVDATLSMPSEAGRSWPFNTSDFAFSSTYSNGLLNTDLSGQTIIPSQLLSTFPFNITDIVVLVDYKENNINGNITFHAVSGLPLGDAIAYISGNRTELHLNGSLTVVYGNFFGTEVSAAKIDDMLGNFTSMIDQMSAGSVECTQFNAIKTPLLLDSTEYGANVEYNITLRGNFTEAIAKLVSSTSFGYSAEEASPVIEAALESFSSSVQNASVKLMYYYSSKIATVDLHSTCDVKAALSKAFELVPAAVPSGNKTIAEAWIKIANATASAYEDVGFNASFSSATQKLDLQGFVSANASRVEKETVEFLPDTVPPELRGMIESYVNTTYCKLKSSSATFDSTNGTVNFVISETFEGDFKAEVNHEKRFMKDYMDAITPYPYPYQYYSPWMFTYPFAALDDIEVDFNNFKAELNSGSDWIYLSFSGVLLQPPKDEVDSVRFGLSRFFNITAGIYIPRTEFDRLRITIAGGTETNQTVLLFAPSPRVPTPVNASLDYASMTWQNTDPSNLRDLRFLIAYQAVVSYAGLTESVPIVTNSTISSFSFNPGAKTMSFNVEGATGTGFCNVTVPKSVLYASAGEWSVKIDGVTLPPASLSMTENAEYVFIYFSYSHSLHLVEITGTWAVPEFQPNLLLPLFIAASVMSMIIAVRKRRRDFSLNTR